MSVHAGFELYVGIVGAEIIGGVQPGTPHRVQDFGAMGSRDVDAALCMAGRRFRGCEAPR